MSTQAVLLNAVDIPFTASSLMPDNGLALLAACLLQRGHGVKVWDPGCVRTLEDHLDARLRGRVRQQLSRPGMVEDLELALALEEEIAAGLGRVYGRIHQELDRHIRRRSCRLLGLKLWIGPGYRAAMEVAARLARDHPDLKVVAGGPLATLAPRAVLRDNPAVAAVCAGEGEEAVVGLAEHCDRGRPLETIPNLLYRDGTRLRATERRLPRLDTLPTPTYAPEVNPALGDREQLRVLCLSESRGCPMGCHFCTHGRLSGHAYRALTPPQIVAQMDRLHRDTGATHFRFSGSFTTGKTYSEVGRLLRRRGAPYRYAGFAHLNAFTPAQLRGLPEAGLVALFFGLESGSERLLRGPLGKAITPARAARVLGAGLDSGVFTCGSVIFPSPGESARSEERTLDLLLEIFEGRPNGAVPLLPPFPQPGSAWGEEMARFGFSGSEGAILAAANARRFRRFIPSDLLDPLPFTLDGVPWPELSARRARMARRLRAAGVLVDLSDDTVLIADAAGHPPREFHRLNHEIFMYADGDRARQLVARVASRRPAGQPADPEPAVPPGATAHRT